MRTIFYIIQQSKSFFLILLIAVLFVPSATAAFKYLHEGMKLPTIESIDIRTGETVSSESVLKDNNMIIIVFWSTWSRRSLEELKALKEICLMYPNDRFKIIAVNVEGQKISPVTKDTILRLSEEMELPFPVIIDHNLEIFYQFGVIAVPSTAITDTTGVIRFGPAGFSLTTHDLIIDSIDVLLGKKELADTTMIMKKGYIPKIKASRYYNLALNLNNKRMYERALSNVAIAVENDSLFPVPYSLMGEIYKALQENEKALANYKKAVELDSTFVAAWSGIGEVYYANKQIDSAMTATNRALSLDEFFTPALLNLALCYSALGDSGNALANLKIAQELNQRDPKPYFYLGQIYLESSDTVDALQSYMTALEILFPAP